MNFYFAAKKYRVIILLIIICHSQLFSKVLEDEILPDYEINRSCPVACPTGQATFCGLSVGTRGLCVSGPTQFLSPITACDSSLFIGPMAIANADPSSSCSNGALTVAGGVGIGEDLNVCGLITALGGFSGPGMGSGGGITGPTGATGSVDLIVPSLAITGTVASTGCSNGALTIAGGVGVGGDLNVCGMVTASGFNGSSINSTDFLFAYDVTTQVALNTFSNAIFSITSPQTNGWINNVNSFTCPDTGIYLISYTGEFTTGIALVNVAMLAIFNGVEIPGSYSNGTITGTGNVEKLEHTFLATCVGGQNLSIQYVCDSSTNASLQGGSGPGTAVVKPSVTVTITRVA